MHRIVLKRGAFDGVRCRHRGLPQRPHRALLLLHHCLGLRASGSGVHLPSGQGRRQRLLLVRLRVRGMFYF